MPPTKAPAKLAPFCAAFARAVATGPALTDKAAQMRVGSLSAMRHTS